MQVEFVNKDYLNITKQKQMLLKFQILNLEYVPIF